MLKTVVLCGGQGSRIGEVTQGVLPKPLVEVDGRPILWHILDLYDRQGFSDFIICAGHLGHKIKDYFANYRLRDSDIRVRTATGEIELMPDRPRDWTVTIADTGETTMTAGRISRISRYLDPEGHFFLTYGDGLADVNLKSLLAFHRSHGRLATLTGVTPPGRFGELLVEAEKVLEMREKPVESERLINGGFMVLDRQFVERYCAVEGADDIMLEREPLENAARDGELMIYRHTGFWQCMDTMRDWELLNRLAKGANAPWR